MNKNKFLVVVICNLFLLTLISTIYTIQYRNQRDLYEERILSLNNNISDLNTEINKLSSKVSSLEDDINKKKSEITGLSESLCNLKTFYDAKFEKSEFKMYHLESSRLSQSQLERADKIAHVVANNYNTYGVLPSVAVGQAMLETQIGGASTPASNSYGYWGVKSRSGFAKYDSLEGGIFGYLNCLNNGYYNKALYQTDPLTSLIYIQSGGYCGGNYASDVYSVIQQNNFTKYDEYYILNK